MSSWDDVMAAAPDLAKAAQARFEAQKHSILATIRVDGSPRVSGTETLFAGGQLWLGSMPDSRKSADLLRDGRLALHSMPDLEMQEGDAKISGRAVHVVSDEDWAAYGSARADEGPPLRSFDLFRVDVTEVVLSRVVGDHMVIESWNPTRGVQSVDRR